MMWRRAVGIHAAAALAALLLSACARGEDPNFDASDVLQDATTSSCSSNADCIGNGGRFCDPASHRCVACLPSMDSCPMGQVCDPVTLTCAPGCRSESECRSGAIDAGVITDAGTLPDGGVPPVGRTHCLTTERRCVECINDAHCPAGAICQRNVCVPGCNAGHACPLGRTCCSGSCVDTQRDLRNCGACNRACDGTNNACCAGRCTNTNTDPANCGACGSNCAPQHATGRCAAGMCSIGMCESGWANVDGMPANGCECATDTNANSCAAATSLGTLDVGAMRTITGNLVPAGSDDWFVVSFAMGGHPRIQFMSNPGMMYSFEVRSNCGADVFTCPDRPEGATGLVDWEVQDTPGMHTSRDVPWPTTVFIRVRTSAMMPMCANYALVISD